MRKLAVIFALLLGLAIGYLCGCRSHGQAHTVRPEFREGQRWVDRCGHIRIVRTMRVGRVFWYRDGSVGRDHECSVATWWAWVRAKEARAE
jgi:hypothetical protein